MSALQQINAEMGVPLDELLTSVEAALASAYRRAFNPPGFITVHIDPQTGDLAVESRVVTDTGLEVIENLPTGDFRRLAAQTARSAVMKQLRNLEKDKALSEISSHRGELASGAIDRVEHGTCYIDLGRVEGVMPPEEQIPGEALRPGRLITIVILDPRTGWKGPQVTVSRAHRVFVQRLMEAEVPEIGSGAVVIRAIAREPGLRTKVAVSSDQSGIDPVGACVGPKGVRHRSLLAELGQEHVDIVPWFEDPAPFIAAALGPATVVEVNPDKASRTATVLVPRSQLSLAIGKDGQNARLAAKLTGWRIDIKASSDASEGEG
ncbi:MAG TPA: transcription termination factor NusA [Candidatus Dormibacteraeota bacterium]|nr:transcription termination factor NusA [Candidatus Dormibacteraeota bacterium]